MKSLIVGICFAVLLPLMATSQGLFESSVNTEAEYRFPVEIGGYGRGVSYIGGYTAANPSEVHSAYGEGALQLRGRSGSWGKLFTELRFRGGYEYNEWIDRATLREAYVELYPGKFEIRAGQAIVSWGRADVFNPTDNLTPRDYFVRSPEPDDMRLGNFLVRTRFSPIPNLRFEGVWVPRYTYSEYRFDLFEMPGYIRFSNSIEPEATLNNGSVGLKMDFLFERFDGSLSYFNGFDPMPGVEPGDIPQAPAEDMVIDMYAKAFRQHTLGLDFSFGLGSFGVRGEAALRTPAPDYRDRVHAPNADLRYILETDRSFGDFRLLIMYAGQYVFDFEHLAIDASMPDINPQEIQDPAFWTGFGSMMERQVRSFNRIIFDQTREFMHILGLRPAYYLARGTASIELFGMYNVSTEEWGIRPALTWDISDNLKLTLGGEYFEGPGNTRYHFVAPVLNAGFIELRYSY